MLLEGGAWAMGPASPMSPYGGARCRENSAPSDSQKHAHGLEHPPHVLEELLVIPRLFRLRAQHIRQSWHLDRKPSAFIFHQSHRCC
jgi:hypothetical protein